MKINKEYQEKQSIKSRIVGYYKDKVSELNLKPFSRIREYLEELDIELSLPIKRNLIFAHLDFEQFITNIVRGKEFTVVSGFNPSSSFHLGHKVLFDVLVTLQKLGATIYIPITNDESYLDNKVESLAEGRKKAYELIPDIYAFGLDPKKTKIFVLSDYPEIYNFAIHLSKTVKNSYVETVFGKKALDNSGKAFYRSAVQLAQILLPQLEEFGGPKPTLIPVGIDQHPYILLARDVAKKLGYVPPAEVAFKFQVSLKDPTKKMSGSEPETAIYLTDTPEQIRSKISKAYTGSVAFLEEHKRLGGIPDVCPVFSLLQFHHPDDTFVEEIRNKYENGELTAAELKEITSDFVISLVAEHNEKRKAFEKQIPDLLKTPLRSLLSE